MFGGKDIVAGAEVLAPDQMHRQAFGRVSAQRSGLMLRQAELYVVCVTNVVTAIVAAQEVGVEGHCFGLLWWLAFDKLRLSGVRNYRYGTYLNIRSA